MNKIKERLLVEGEHNGFTYCVLHNGNGYRCGYVKIPKDHRWFGQEYDDIGVDCHGGLTFGKMIDDEFWIGFDCAHLGDKQDKSLPYIIDMEAYSFGEPAMIRSTEYCVGQCKAICDQML